MNNLQRLFLPLDERFEVRGLYQVMCIYIIHYLFIYGVLHTGGPKSMNPFWQVYMANDPAL